MAKNMARWRHIDTLPDNLEDCPDMIIVWNDCNGPHFVILGCPEFPHDLKKDGCWVAWRECPRPSKAEEKRLLKTHKRVGWR